MLRASKRINDVRSAITIRRPKQTGTIFESVSAAGKAPADEKAIVALGDLVDVGVGRHPDRAIAGPSGHPRKSIRQTVRMGQLLPTTMSYLTSDTPPKDLQPKAAITIHERRTYDAIRDTVVDRQMMPAIITQDFQTVRCLRHYDAIRRMEKCQDTRIADISAALVWQLAHNELRPPRSHGCDQVERPRENGTVGLLDNRRPEVVRKSVPWSETTRRLAPNADCSIGARQPKGIVNIENCLDADALGRSERRREWKRSNSGRADRRKRDHLQFCTTDHRHAVSP